MTYTKDNVQAYLSALDELADYLTDSKDAAEEWIAALDDADADEDEMGAIVQSFEDSLDSVRDSALSLGKFIQEGMA